MRSRKRTSNTFFSSVIPSTADDDAGPSPTKRLNQTKDGPGMGNYDPKYPESLTAFADGLRSDVMELIGTSAGLLNRSINFIFPFIGTDNGESGSINDSLHDIEIKNIKTKENNTLKTKQGSSSHQEILRMRCPSLWSKDSLNGSSAAPAPGGAESSSQSQAQKGGKVLLDKLIKNASIQSFPCGDSEDHLVILGNVRMIVAKKNFDQLNSASILWSQPYREIGTCAINCSIGYVSLHSLSLSLDLSLSLFL
jgi:hypothetical protein